ncbi:MAG: renalase [Candidatus Paceibacteria bacterium]|jgi:renalase
MTTVAVIGAGLAGVVVAKALDALPGVNVTIFDKSRGMGGRMSTRRSETHSFDHGVPFFTARDPEFVDFLKTYIASGQLADWRPQVVTLALGEKAYRRMWYEPHYVGVPQMNSLAKAVAADLDVIRGVEIKQISGVPGNWQLDTQQGDSLGVFDWVVVATPAEQALRLLPPGSDINSGANSESNSEAISERVSEKVNLQDVQFDPCFSLMIALPVDYSMVARQPGLRTKLRRRFDVASVKNSPLKWLIFDQTRPGRHGAPALLAQTTGDWAAEHFDVPLADVQQQLLEVIELLLGPAALGPEPREVSLHRWRYAQVREALGQPYMELAGQQLALCGDWCRDVEEGRRGVEAAYVSARALALRLKIALAL